MSRPCVWGVGFPRTGTRSFAQAMRHLGWTARHNPRGWNHLHGFNAASDVFITAHWRELMLMFPNSKLVLTTRDFDDWTRSLRRIPGFWQSRKLFDRWARMKVYGTNDVMDHDALRAAWDRHHARIREDVPPERLLELPQPFAWEPLCEFLGVPVANIPFPFLNKLSCKDAVVDQS